MAASPYDASSDERISDRVRSMRLVSGDGKHHVVKLKTQTYLYLPISYEQADALFPGATPFGEYALRIELGPR